jgi:hypothetical protein
MIWSLVHTLQPMGQWIRSLTVASPNFYIPGMLLSFTFLSSSSVLHHFYLQVKVFPVETFILATSADVRYC